MRRSILLFVLCFAAAPSLRATVLLPAEFREIVSGSQVIVYGRVIDVQSDWTDDRRAIETLVRVRAGTYLKGGPGEVVTFRVPGGQVGRYKNVVVGAPEFRLGEEAVLFLRADGPSIPAVFGLNQGVYRVNIQIRTGRRTVTPPALLGTSDTPRLVTRGTPDRQLLLLDAFSSKVKAVIAEGQR